VVSEVTLRFWIVASFWFCGKVIAEPKATMWIGEFSCLKARM
jgi:hypothetical protein